MGSREAKANLRRSAFQLVSTKTDKRTGIITAIIRSNINFLGSDIHLIKSALQEAYPGASINVRKTRASESKRLIGRGTSVATDMKVQSVTFKATITPAGVDSRKVRQTERSGRSRQRRRRGLFGIKLSGSARRKAS